MSAMTHCQWAAGYHGNRTSEHSRPDHVATFHGTFQLCPCVVPIHRASVNHCVCVCLSVDQGRKVCGEDVNSAWITSHVVFHCVNQGYILGQWPIFYYDFCLYTCAVWYIEGCIWSCNVSIVWDQNPTVTIPHSFLTITMYNTVVIIGQIKTQTNTKDWWSRYPGFCWSLS